MLKLRINDPSIRIIPSKKLKDFIKTIKQKDSMPENVLKIYKNQKNIKVSNQQVEEIPNPQFTKAEIEILKKLHENCETERLDDFIPIVNNSDDEDICDNPKNKKIFYLNLNDIKWINKCLESERKANNDFKLYLHELMKESKIILPKNELQERNPELEERCKKLRHQQETYLYNKMTKGVDTQRRRLPEDTISYQIKQINKQLIAVAQFIFSVLAGFAFGFIGVPLLLGEMDFGFRLLLGIICALTIALAEIYFLAKKLNEDDTYIDEVSNKKSPDGKFKFE